MSFRELLQVGASALVDPTTGGEWITYQDGGTPPGRVIAARVVREEPDVDPNLSQNHRVHRAVVLVLNHASLGVAHPRPKRDKVIVRLQAGADPKLCSVEGILQGTDGSWELEVRGVTDRQDVIHRDTAFTLTSNAPSIARAFRKAPGATFFHVRDLVGQVFGSHRREWLAQTRVKMRRGQQGMTATPVTEQPTIGGWRGRAFFYRVSPRNKRPERPDLREIQGEVYTTSVAAELLEFGGTVRPRTGRMLALPIGVTLRRDGRPVPIWRTPDEYRASRPGNELVALDLGDGPKLFQKRRGAAAARKAGARSQLGEGRKRSRERTILLPAYALVPSTEHDPKLRFYATWSALKADRDRRVAATMDKLLREVASG